MHHFKGKRPSSTRNVFSYPMAFEMHFLAFVLVLKLVRVLWHKQGLKKKIREKKEKEGGGRKGATKMFVYLKDCRSTNRLPQPLPGASFTWGMDWAEKHKPQQVPAHQREEDHIWWGLRSGYWLVSQWISSKQTTTTNNKKQPTDKITWLMAKLESQYK